MLARRTVLLVVAMAAVLSLAARGAVARSSAAGNRTLTLVNRTRATIWPAAWPGSAIGGPPG
jgi:hypothetical protein